MHQSIETTAHNPWGIAGNLASYILQLHARTFLPLYVDIAC